LQLRCKEEIIISHPYLARQVELNNQLDKPTKKKFPIAIEKLIHILKLEHWLLALPYGVLDYEESILFVVSFPANIETKVFLTVAIQMKTLNALRSLQ
jgi:hypothetical protein